MTERATAEKPLISGQFQEAIFMEWSFVFFLNSALLGVGLAMDAFSVSLANGLHDPIM